MPPTATAPAAPDSRSGRRLLPRRVGGSPNHRRGGPRSTRGRRGHGLRPTPGHGPRPGPRLAPAPARGAGEAHAYWESGLIETARAAGASWADLADPLGVASRQAAERRYLRLRPGPEGSTGEQRVRATRDRRAGDRSITTWARENAADLRSLAGRITALADLPAAAGPFTGPAPRCARRRRRGRPGRSAHRPSLPSRLGPPGTGGSGGRPHPPHRPTARGHHGPAPGRLTGAGGAPGTRGSRGSGVHGAGGALVPGTRARGRTHPGPGRFGAAARPPYGRGQGLRATRPHWSTGTASSSSGRHRSIGTNPGSTSSSPSAHPVISSGSRTR